MYALIGEKLVALVPYEEANIFALKMWDSYLACTALFHHLFRPFSPRSHSLLLRACIYKYFEETPNLCLCPEKNERTYDENWDDVPVEANGPTLPLTPLHGQ
ncbi:hypothetical protein TNCV_2937351 [Trichonephila clavipes]|nr:hypothetical protein TNCV_2937351 [Trichonephila clavipes]